MQLEFTSSALWLIGIIVVSGFLTYLLYGSTEVEKSWHKWILMPLRFLSLCIIGLLLLNPLLKRATSEKIETKNLLFVDDSRSMSQITKSEQEAISSLVNEAKSNNSTEVYYFSDIVTAERDSLPYQGNYSDLSAPFEFIHQNFASNEVASIGIVSDGIQNRGLDPRHVDDMASPVFTMTLGDTTAARDISVERVISSEVAFLNDQIKIDVDLAGQDYPSSRANIKLQEKQGPDWRTLKEKNISVSPGEFYDVFSLEQSFSSPGIKEMRIVSNTLPSEKNTRNNTLYFQVDVIDNRQTLEILTYTTHPDIGKIVSMTKNWENFKTKVIHLGQGETPSKDASVYLLYDIPNRQFRQSQAVVNELLESNKPLFFMLSPMVDPNAFNRAIKAVRIDPNSSGTDVALSPGLSDDFSLFTMGDDWAKTISAYPPLHGLYAKYVFSANPHVLLYQKIGNIETKEPLLFFVQEKSKKLGILTGTNLFRWPLYEYAVQSDHHVFDELLSQSLQYLSTREDNKKLRARINKRVFEQGEKVFFSAELYNDSYEPITNQDIRLMLFDSIGQEYDYIFSRASSGYSLALTPPGKGRYTYLIKDEKGLHPAIEGNFVVTANQIEMAHLQANYGVLRDLANRSGGRSFDSDQGTEMLSSLTDSELNKPILISQTKTTSLIDLSTLLWLLLLFLGAEWVLRRIWIGY